MRKKECCNCRKVFSLCECEAPDWNMNWCSFEMFDGAEHATWDHESKQIMGDYNLAMTLKHHLSGSEVDIAFPGTVLRLYEWNPYAVQYVATVILRLKTSADAPDYRDLIQSIPGAIY